MARLQNVVLTVQDMEKMAQFYSEALSLSLRFRDGEKWTQLTDGEHFFALAAPEEMPFSASGSIPIFEVENVESARDQMTELGAVVSTIRDMGDHGLTATVTDPEGNLFQIFMRKM